MTTAAGTQRRPRAIDTVRSRAEAVPWWGWLAALVVVSTATRFVVAVRYPGPWIFNDEITYSDLARSLGRTGHFAIRGGTGTGGFGFVYSALVAPAYAVFSSIPHAYDAARAINSLLMSLAAIPTYFLARRLVGPWLSLLAATFALLIPSLTYTASMMTEVAFFPLVMISAWSVVAALERPTIFRQLLMFVPMALAFYTRAQGVILLAAVATALLLIPLSDSLAAPGRRVRRFVEGLRPYAVAWAVLLSGAVAAVGLQAARGQPLRALLGTYGGVALFDYSIGGIARWFFFHLGEIDVYAGVIPFAAFLFCVYRGLRPRETDRSLRIFAAVGVSFVFWFALTAAAFASSPAGNRIEERYFFHIVPLFFVGFVVWIARPVDRWLPFAASAVVAAALPGAVPWDSLLDSNAVNGAFALLPMITLTRHGVSPQSIAEVVSLSALATALLYVATPRRFLAIPVILVAVYLLALDRNVEHHTYGAAEGSLRSSISGQRNWIDAAVGDDADVAILFFATDQTRFWQNEFFNASVRRVYNLTSGIYDPLPQTLVRLRPRSGRLVAADGAALTAPYVLVNEALVPRGTEVARDRNIGMSVYRVRRPLELAAMIGGIYPDRWSGSNVTYTRYGCSGGTVTARLLSDRVVHPDPMTIIATSGTKQTGRLVVRPGLSSHLLKARAISHDGVCSISYAVPTVVPSQTVPGNTDTRALGIRFLSFAYSPSP
jgi:hypothetical protein